MERKNAFNEIAPQSSSSLPRVMRKGPCDVFSNHRGCDTKRKLASTIYHTLDLVGLRVFLDENDLVLGDSIPEEIEKAMSTAGLHIAIFSQSYAQSPWCLAELSFMLKTGTPILPVFYHVRSDDLRWVARGRGLYASAIKQHEEKGRYSAYKLEEWQTALQRVSYFSGYTVNSDYGDEGTLLKSIVNSVLKVIKKEQLEVAKHPVGLDEIVKDFERSRQECIESEQQVQIVGIVGFGGSGKTTLATELYNRKRSSFNLTSFLHDVRDAASKNALHTKQKKLLEDLGFPAVSFDNVREGKRIVEERLRSLSVLIVLDDVEDQDQLDSLLPSKENLGPGSLIIFTTRELGVLTSWGISSIYKMGMMSLFYAKQLFCWHAFLQPSPPEGFEHLVEIILNKCNGLPLSIKVFGGYLYGRPKNYWEGLLERISTVLPQNIRQCFKLSYDSLEQEEQEKFLDIACFFIGEKKSLAIAIWDASGWIGEYSWQVLENKCLVEIDGQNRIRMHDHLRDFGREIAVQHSPYRVWSRGRIKTPSQITMPIRGIMAATTQFAASSAHDEFPRCSSHFQPPFKELMELMKNSSIAFKLDGIFSLELLAVTENDFTEEFANVSKDLVWLRWYDFKHSNLPSWLSLEKLRVLELFGASSLNELWKDNAHPPLQLRELSITTSWGASLERVPSSISRLKHLKKLSFIGYLGEEIRIKRLPEEFCDLQSLEHLELRHCKLLSTLPIRFGELTNLRHIDLCSSEELRMLPVSFKMLTQLQYLDLSGCRKLRIPRDILENMTKLEKLDFSGCCRLFELPSHITEQPSLRELHVRDTCLKDVPDTIGQLGKLETLRIGSPLLKNLPASIRKLYGLTFLEIYDCLNLESLPNSLGQLNQLQFLRIELSGIMSLPKSFCRLTNLQTLEISDCPITELDLVSGNASSMPNLKAISLTKTSLRRISISEELCPELQTLQLQQNDNLVEMDIPPRYLPSDKASEF